MTVRGQRIEHAMRTAHARIGDIDWELIEPLDDRSICAEHLRSRGEGVHHILFATCPVEISYSKIGGVPGMGVSNRNVPRMLINLHGGGFIDRRLLRSIFRGYGRTQNNLVIFIRPKILRVNPPEAVSVEPARSSFMSLASFIPRLKLAFSSITQDGSRVIPLFRSCQGADDFTGRLSVRFTDFRMLMAVGTLIAERRSLLSRSFR